MQLLLGLLALVWLEICPALEIFIVFRNCLEHRFDNIPAVVISELIYLSGIQIIVPGRAAYAEVAVMSSQRIREHTFIVVLANESAGDISGIVPVQDPGVFTIGFFVVLLID